MVSIYHAHKSMGAFWTSFLIGGGRQKGAEVRTRTQTSVEKLGLRNPLAVAQRNSKALWGIALWGTREPSTRQYRDSSPRITLQSH